MAKMMSVVTTMFQSMMEEAPITVLGVMVTLIPVDGFLVEGSKIVSWAARANPWPTYMKAHRWGGAFPTTSIAPEEKCIVIDDRRIAVCGDFCVSPKVEGAILSGMHASERLGKLL